MSTGLGDSLRFWDLNRPTAAPETIAGTIGVAGLNSPLRPSPNGRLMAVAGDKALAVWDTEARRFIHEGRSGANGLAFSKGSALVEIWFLPEMVKREVHPDHTLFLTDVAVSNDGTRLATSAQDGDIKLWDVAAGKRQDVFAGQLVGFWSVAFSPDDSRLAAGGFDGSVTLWDLATHPHRQVAQWKAAWKFCKWLEFRQDGGALFTLGDFTTETGGRHSVIRCWPAPTLVDIDARQPQIGR